MELNVCYKLHGIMSFVVISKIESHSILVSSYNKNLKAMLVFKFPENCSVPSMSLAEPVRHGISVPNLVCSAMGNW